MAEISERQQIRYLARLGAVMCAANYPVPLVRGLLERAAWNDEITISCIVLPNNVQVMGASSEVATVVESIAPKGEFRFDQTFALGKLIFATLEGELSAAEGEQRLNELLNQRPPYRSWVTALGYGIWSGGLVLVLEPSPLNVLLAVVLGVLVGAFVNLGSRFPMLSNLIPVFSAFTVSAVCITAAQLTGLDHVGLRAIIPPLAVFLPGAAITLAVIELTSRDIVSGSARLMSGMVQLAQLAFGILIATQVVGNHDTHLTADPVNTLGPWAPWLGVLVYSIGVMFFLAPPRSFLPWLLVVAYLAFAGQFFGDVLLGSYASGIIGGAVLMIAALAISRIRSSPPAITLVLPGFWLLVPGGMGLIGFAEIFGAEGDSALPSTLISMIAVALGIQVALACWQLFRSGRGHFD